MFTLSVALLISAADPTPAAATDPKAVRAAVERSLTSLKTDGLDWMTSKKCASCHAVPMTVWSRHEVEKRGFAVDATTLDDLEMKALKTYTGHPKFKPVSQDGTGDGLSKATVYLLLGASAAAHKSEETEKELDRLAGHLLKTQQSDGSWKGNAASPPVNDTDDATTALAVLALGAWDGDRTACTESRERALTWLRSAKLSPDNQSLALRLLVWHRFGKEAEWRPLEQELRKRQNKDGGWSQVRENPSDALATGQALYALAALGATDKDAAVVRAWDYLVRTQLKNGSWLVKTRVKNGHDVIISYHGSAWAAMGLADTLPQEKEKVAAK
jgi:hypothetical protein